MKIALVHDWLVSLGGAETVLEQMYILYPEADIYTLFSDQTLLNKMNFSNTRVVHSSLQKIPFINKIYRKLPNFFPKAIEEFDFSSYDLVISSSHAVAKGVLTDAKTCHISYIHTPMRYIWDLTADYLKRANFSKPIEYYTRNVFHQLRTWDIVSSLRPDYFIANSHFIKRRIQKIYRRESTVIHPPVNLSDIVYTDKQNYYVTASRLVPYKNIPLIAVAFAQMPDKKLVILGDGPDRKKVEGICKTAPNIEYRGYQERAQLLETIGQAKAFVFAAEEDFGILPVEAQSLGTPVIAYGVGGTRETVQESITGVFFDQQTTDSIKQAVTYFESLEDRFDPQIIAQQSQRFSQQEFCRKFKQSIEESYHKFHI
ncbi:MAG: glycosyltransferase [Brevinema sp.]